MRQENLSLDEAVQKLLSEPYTHQVFLKVIREKTDAHLEKVTSENVFELAIVYGQPRFRSVAVNGYTKICSRWFAAEELSSVLNMPNVTVMRNYLLIPASSGISVPPFDLFQKETTTKESKPSLWNRIWGTPR